MQTQNVMRYSGGDEGESKLWNSRGIRTRIIRGRRDGIAVRATVAHRKHRHHARLQAKFGLEIKSDVEALLLHLQPGANSVDEVGVGVVVRAPRARHDVGAPGAIGGRAIHFRGTHNPLAALQRPIVTEGGSEGGSRFDSLADALLWEMI
jgi:hypothetical protein